MAARAPIRLAASDRRQQILEVAATLFARKGFQGTTTREIAQRAEVNEALVFRHFPSKDELYWGVLDAKCRGGSSRDNLRRRLQQIGNARELFVTLAEDLLNRDVTLSRLLWFSALENHKLSDRYFHTYIAKYYEELAYHIEKRIATGEFRRVDPMLAARGFLGMIGYHFLIQELFGGKRFQKFDAREVCETLVDIWLTGMEMKRPTLNGKGRFLNKN